MAPPNTPNNLMGVTWFPITNVMVYKPEPPTPCKTRRPIRELSDFARPPAVLKAPKRSQERNKVFRRPIPSDKRAKIRANPKQFSACQLTRC